MSLMDNLQQATDYDHAKKLVGGMHPAHDSIQRENFQNGKWLVFYNDKIRFGYRMMPSDHDRYGLHVQGFVGDNVPEFARGTVSIAKDLGLPYVYFKTDNDKILNDVSTIYDVEMVQKHNDGNTYRVRVQ